MRLVKKGILLSKQLRTLKQKGKTVGFVPTMGFLHEGHLSLIRKAKKENDIVVVSIFVNPIQFGPHEDFKTYPRDLKRDIKLLDGLCDFIFAPSAQEMYSEDFTTFVDVKGLDGYLCGRARKGHFRGVATVICKLFNIILPDRAYFGQKDRQQALIIKRLARDLNYFTVIKVLPTVREKDGLAMSSRNARFKVYERRDAVVLFQALKSAQRLVVSGLRDTGKIKKILEDFIRHKESAKIDYIEIVDKASLEPLKRIEKEALLALAVYIGEVRLIDNIDLKRRKA